MLSFSAQLILLLSNYCTMTETINCKNCGAAVSSKFCGECGQKASTKRFDLHFVFSELIEKVLPVDRGLIFTSWQLLKSPGASMREYLAGKRVNYTKPLNYTLVLTALSLFFFSGKSFKDGVVAGMGTDTNERAQAAMKQFFDFVDSNMTLMVIILIPILALVSVWFFRKKRLNYAEFLVLCAYYTAASTLIGIPFSAILKYNSAIEGVWLKIFGLLMALVYFVYFVWAYVLFFEEDRAIVVAIKATLVYTIAYLLYILLISVSMAALMFAYG